MITLRPLPYFKDAPGGPSGTVLRHHRSFAFIYSFAKRDPNPNPTSPPPPSALLRPSPLPPPPPSPLPRSLLRRDAEERVLPATSDKSARAPGRVHWQGAARRTLNIKRPPSSRAFRTPAPAGSGVKGSASRRRSRPAFWALHKFAGVSPGLKRPDPERRVSRASPPVSSLSSQRELRGRERHVTAAAPQLRVPIRDTQWELRGPLHSF